MEKRIPKKTGTYADPLCAIGYASILEEMTGAPATVSDEGAEYVVNSEGGRPEGEWSPPSPGFMYIWRKSEEPRPVGERILDYEREKEIADVAKKSNATAAANRRQKEALAEVSDTQPVKGDPDYRFAAIIESMRKGWTSDKTLYRWVESNPTDARDAVLRAFQGTEPTVDVKWSNSQILNPSTGKGIHASKTVAKSASGFKLVETFDEWMKLRGLGNAMVTYRVDDDFKFCVLEPGRITVSSLGRIRNDLRDAGLWGGVRLDIELTLHVLRLLLRHSEYEQGGTVFRKRRPRDIIRGIRVSYFKSLGTAAALMNDSLFPLPSWFAVETKADYDAYCAIINEPYGDRGETKSGPLSGLDEKHSDDVSLLQDYRRWLLSGDLADLLEFHSRFAGVIMPRKAGGNYFREFDSRVLTLLLTKGYGMIEQFPVSEIVSSNGFLNLASAIRNTTIRAVGKSPNNREPRFGLAQRFKQRIKAGKSEFLQELSEFVQSHNWEIQHKLKGTGYLVGTSDLDEVISLIERAGQNGHYLVGMLLIAYGFSFAKSPTTETPSPQE